jgi:predicted TIM-barrel fold metal-dependent hydrolase
MFEFDSSMIDPIIDADAHVLEPNEIWAERVPEDRRADAPRTLDRDPIDWNPLRDLRWWIELRSIARARGMQVEELGQRVRVRLRDLGFRGEPVWRDVADGVWKQGTVHTVRTHLDAAMRNFDAEAQSEALRRLGVGRAHLFPTAGLWVLAIDEMDPELASALSRAYNDWLDEFCRHDPELLRPVGALALHDVDAATREVERLAARGWSAVMIRPNPIRGRPLGHPLHEPLFTACERLGLAIAIHEGSHARQTTVGWERFATRFARHACSHPLEHMLAFTSLLERGVFERHPGLRVAFMEAGCSWLPYWLHRLDEEFRQLAWEVEGSITRPPSEYFRRQCFVSCDPGEPLLREVVDLLGSDRLLYGSDYPHIDHDAAVRDDAAKLVERLGLDVARRILQRNPDEFYR